jgi:hypothetical protein
MSGWGLFLFERKEQIDEARQYDNLLKSIIKVWERKYSNLYSEFNKPRLTQKIKEVIKKIKPVYKAYTKTHQIIMKFK